jgi:serine/threonine-protein kinase RsbT
MTVLKSETTSLQTEADIVRVRQAVRQWAIAQGFSLVDQTKLVTATSELARNTVVYGGGGTVQLDALTMGSRRGLRLIFVDQGPGIPDIAQAMADGYTTGEGLGLGLGGTKRLVNEFEITSHPGAGTRVCITKWK